MTLIRILENSGVCVEGKGGAQETSVKVRRQTARPWAPHEGETRALKPEAGSARGAGKAGGPHESEAGFKRSSSGAAGLSLQAGIREKCQNTLRESGICAREKATHTRVYVTSLSETCVYTHTCTRVRASWVHLRAQT